MKTPTDVGVAVSIERAPDHRRVALRHAQTCERSCRVIWSIAVRRALDGVDAVAISPVRRMTISISENVASEMIIAITSVIEHLGEREAARRAGGAQHRSSSSSDELVQPFVGGDSCSVLARPLGAVLS